jgi:hypothetical protein
MGFIASLLDSRLEGAFGRLRFIAEAIKRLTAVNSGRRRAVISEADSIHLTKPPFRPSVQFARYALPNYKCLAC